MPGSTSLGPIDIVSSEDLQELATHDGPPNPAESTPAVTDKLIDLAVTDVLAKRGAIEATDDSLPTDSPIAAILRY